MDGDPFLRILLICPFLSSLVMIWVRTSHLAHSKFAASKEAAARGEFSCGMADPSVCMAVMAGRAEMHQATVVQMIYELYEWEAVICRRFRLTVVCAREVVF